jgi:hypothetical protein
MATKMTGAQFKAFYTDPATWAHQGEKECWYIEEMALRVDGQEVGEGGAEYGDEYALLPDAAQVVVDGGYFGWQGKGPEPAKGDMATEARRWLKAQTHVALTVTIDKSNPTTAAFVVAAIQALGGQVVGAPGDWPALSDPQQAAIKERFSLPALTGLMGSPEEVPASPAPRRPRRHPGHY